MTSTLKKMAASSSKQQDVVAGATLDGAHLGAIRAWLSTSQSLEELRASIQASPVAFLAAHIHSLPAHLLEPFASKTTAQQRASVPLVLERRRRWAARHNERPSRASADDVEGGEENHAHILDLKASRQRLPDLWASTVGQSSIASSPTPQRRPTRPRNQQQLDPPFPDHPAATVNGYETAAAASGSARKYGPAHEGDLYSHPRLTRLMDEQDDEERREEEREREARRAGEPEEDEEEEDEMDDQEMEDDLVEVFQRAVVERFVKGDVSMSRLGPHTFTLRPARLTAPFYPTQPTIPATLYADVDFQDLPEEQEQLAQASSTSSRVEQSDSMMRPSRQQEILDEERYFDDDDDDEDEGTSAHAGDDATNAEIDY